MSLLLSWSFLCNSRSSPCGSAQSWPAVPARTLSVDRGCLLPLFLASKANLLFHFNVFLEVLAVPQVCARQLLREQAGAPGQA